MAEGDQRSPVVRDWEQASYPMDMEAGSAPNFGDFRPPAIDHGVGGLSPSRPVSKKDLDFIPDDSPPIFPKERRPEKAARRVNVYLSDKDFVPASETAERDRMRHQAALEAAKKIMERFGPEIERYHAAVKWMAALTDEQKLDLKLQDHIVRGHAIIQKGLPMDEQRAYRLAYDDICDQQSPR